MKKLLYFSFFVVLMFNSLISFACTSLIISGNVTKDGRPIMMKNRDTGELNNRLEYFVGQKYSFIGVVNAGMKKGEVWSGNNNAGFCIMNTASYNIKNDDVPDSEMDKEGIIMYEALGVCETVDDFERFLAEHNKPLGVEANFGVIDAKGGAAYFEVNNTTWIKYDVNDPEVAPYGYRVMTNFSESGPREKYEGWERYLTASAIMSEICARCEGRFSLDHSDIINSFSRSYRHMLLGIDYNVNPPASGFAVDQDFIPRKSTANVTVFEGVKNGENPLFTVMWTVLGYPSCSVAIPTVVADKDIIPDYMKKSGKKNHSTLCDLALKVKTEKIFQLNISNGNKYLNVANALEFGERCRMVEKIIDESFYSAHNKWVSGEISKDEFYKFYRNNCAGWYNAYLARFAEND